MIAVGILKQQSYKIKFQTLTNLLNFNYQSKQVPSNYKQIYDG